MINFTVGPVQSNDEVRRIGAENVPYFRTPEFSDIMIESEKLIKKFSGVGANGRSLFITGSGTASMEAVIMNVFCENDKVLIVDGGSFGDRFVQLCEIHGIPYTAIHLPMGKTLSREDLFKYDGNGFTGFLVNIHETSTGVYYDPNLISEFCKKNKLFLVVDAISSFLADELNMEELGVDVMITGSQKALACPPGISIIVLSERAIDRVNCMSPRSMYFNLKDMLKNGERGQTPFTPAVGIIRQIYSRLKQIDRDGGVVAERDRIADLARDFRKKITGLPFEITSESLSNAVTPLHPTTASAYSIFETLKDSYGIWVCPNGGKYRDYLFRVGHIGALTKKDNSILIDAFKEMQSNNMI